MAGRGRQSFNSLQDIVGAADLLQEKIRTSRENRKQGRPAFTPPKDRKRTTQADKSTPPKEDKGHGHGHAAPSSSQRPPTRSTASPTANTFANYNAAAAAFKNLSTGTARKPRKRCKMEASSDRMKKSSSNTSMQSTSSDMSSSASNPVIDLETDEEQMQEDCIPLGDNRPEPIMVDLTDEPSCASDDDVIVMEGPPFQPNIFNGVHGVKAENEEPIPKEKLAEINKNQGNEYFRKGDYKNALNKYNEAIRLKYTEATYFSNRAACHYKMCNYTEALNDATASLSIDKSFSRGYERALRAALALGDVTKCELIINEANSIKLGPEADKDRGSLHQLKAHLATKQNHDAKNQYRESLYYAERAIEIAIGSACLKMAKVELLFRLGRQEEAVDYYQLTKNTALGSAEGFYILALCHYYQDNLVSSISSCQRALKTDPDKVKYLKLFKKLKTLHEVREDGKKKYNTPSLVTETRDLFVKCLQLLEDLQTLLTSKNVTIESKVLCNLAKLSNKLKNWDEAVGYATKAIEINPKHAKSFAVRANLYKDKDMFEEAIRDYDNFLKSDPKNVEIKNELHRTKIALAQSKKKDYYKILGVSRNATEDELKKAYKTLAKAHHPDRHSNATQIEQKKQEKLFKDLGQAYAVLSDPTKRRKYDMGAYDENSSGDGFSSAAGFNAGFDPSMFFNAFMNQQGGGGGFNPGGFNQGAGTSRRFYYQ